MHCKKNNLMLRIERLIAKRRIADLINLDEVSKIEIHKSGQNLTKPILHVFIYFVIGAEKGSTFDNELIGKMIKFIDEQKDDKRYLRGIIGSYKRDRFIKESSFDKTKFEMPIEFKQICEKYSQSFFNKWNMELTENNN